MLTKQDAIAEFGLHELIDGKILSVAIRYLYDDQVDLEITVQGSSMSTRQWATTPAWISERGWNTRSELGGTTTTVNFIYDPQKHREKSLPRSRAWHVV